MLRIVLRVEIKKIFLSVSVRGLENRIIITNEYIVLILYINEILSEDVLKTICFTTKVYLVNNLKTNMLINNNIIIS